MTRLTDCWRCGSQIDHDNPECGSCSAKIDPQSEFGAPIFDPFDPHTWSHLHELEYDPMPESDEMPGGDYEVLVISPVFHDELTELRRQVSDGTLSDEDLWLKMRVFAWATQRMRERPE